MWLRNTWAWGRDDRRASLALIDGHSRPGDVVAVAAEHDYLGRYVLAAQGAPEVLFCDNETDDRALFGVENRTPFVKDGIDRYIVHGDSTAVNPAGTGTKVALRYHFDAVAPGATVRVQLRLSTAEVDEHTFGPGTEAVLADRRREADDFYAHVLPERTDDTDRAIARRAFAGLLWNKQLYRYTVDEWLDGDPAQPTPPASRKAGRNAAWRNLALADVICMPDEWEYPWFAAWDTAFHCVALAHVDPAFAKEQLLLLCREWAMHPDGQLPAYEWAFGDVNPPVHAWAAWRVFQTDGGHDHDFLVRVFSKLLFNVGWWVNREDADGSDVFTGGFLGMDNIALFDRSALPPDGARLEESDATSWVAFYFLNMLKIAVQLSLTDPAWDETATKFLEHFLAIARAANSFGTADADLWNEADGFYYDVLVHPDGRAQPLPVRSMVGLLPILAVAQAPQAIATALPDFTARLQWLQRRRPDLMGALVSRSGPHGEAADQLLSLVAPDRLVRMLARVFDESEFLSPYGIRSLSAAYRTPLTVDVGGAPLSIDYEPGESTTDLFGGNSNWRGPVWFPVNVLLADALRTHAGVLGDLTVEVPTGSGRRVSLAAAADEIDRRLIALFRPGPDGRRPSDGARIEAAASPLWREHMTFSEYFHGDTGEGLGASHQTGWTALVAHLICRAAGEPDDRA